jgi:TonB family protein
MKITLILLIFLNLISTANAQIPQSTRLPLSSEQATKLKEINEINTKVVKLYSEKNLKEALTLARSAVETAEKNNLFEKGYAVASLNNLGEIYLTLKREDDAAPLFERAAVIYEKSEGEKSQNLIKVLERLAYLYANQRSSAKAEKIFLRILQFRKSINGTESPEVVKSLSDLGDFYRYSGNTEKAETFHKQAVEISDRVFKPDNEQFDIAANRYECFVYQQKGYREGSAYLEKFYQSRKDNFLPNKTVKVISGKVVNGKAKKLITPPYPDEAKQIRASGVVIVKVKIDESGKVISAKSTCGYSVFARVCEEAALKSLFTPTILDGTPVQVTGNIVYNFVAQ